MADILTFKNKYENQDLARGDTRYSLDVTLHPDHLSFTVHDVQADSGSLLKIADELERIVRIIRTDVVMGVV